MIWRKLLIIIFSVFLFTCGLEEFYYLPQVPEGVIQTSMTSIAAINLPSISNFSWASNYSIFYRIYISESSTEATIDRTQSGLSPINSYLWNDYNYLYPYTDPTNTTAVTGIENEFRRRKYWELDIEGDNISNILTVSGGELVIEFPNRSGEIPTLTTGGVSFPLKRTKDNDLLGKLLPNDDLYFRNYPELYDNENANTEANGDVQSGTGGNTYVSMYIVAVGYNVTTFQSFFSKPTHINIFILPQAN